MLEESSDRITLLYEYLCGNEEARMILADLFEEERDPGLASWARSPSKTVYKRLDFVLAALPYLLTLRFSSEYFRIALQVLAPDHMLVSALSQVVEWTDDPRDELMDSACRVLSSIGPAQQVVYNLDLTTQQMHAAARCAEGALAAAQGTDGNAFRRLLTESKNASRRVAKASRDVRPTFGFAYRGVQVESAGKQAAWQLVYCREQLELILDRDSE